MLNESMLKDLNLAFKRIFAMPITRSTFRELQNATMTVSNADVEVSNKLFESLMQDEAVKGVVEKNSDKQLLEFISEFGILARTARDVFEKGELISLVTTDLITRQVNNQNVLMFLTRIRRVDGEEIQFITDPGGAINLMQHWVGRLGELNNNPATRHIIPNYTTQLNDLMKSIGEMAGKPEKSSS